MIDLMKTYRDARNRAIELMQKGQLSAYIAQLARVNELKLQLINYANTAK
jgi:glutaminase